jgi:hypothetical protein
MEGNLTHWLDIIPAVEIPAGIPYARRIKSESGDRTHREITQAAWEVEECEEAGDSFGEWGGAWTASIRIDLEHPQGVAHTLLWLRSNATVETETSSWFAFSGADILGRWLSGITTDEDRFAIAEAMADIVFAKKGGA